MAEFPPTNSDVASASVKNPLSDAQATKLTAYVMKRQAALSLQVSAVFLVIVFGLPLLNLFAPQVMAMNVGGFTLTWLILGVLFYPLTWLLSGYFINTSNKIEEDCTEYGKQVIAESKEGDSNER